MQAVAQSPRSTAAPAGRLLVSLATYNEADNLPGLVAAITDVSPHADVLIIDDASPDGTGRLADELAAGDPRIHVIHRSGKLGLGTAILAAMRHAIDQGYDFLLNLDADFSHPPRYIPALLAGLRDHDVMIGSRYVPGGGTVNWPASRHDQPMRKQVCSDGIANAGARRQRRVPLLPRGDPAKSGFGPRAFARLLVSARSPVSLPPRPAPRLGEHPIIFENRKAGLSKVSTMESLRSMAMLTRLGLRAAAGRT